MTTRIIAIAGYLTVLAGGVTVQLLSLRLPERVPSLGRVFTHIMRTRTGRVGVCVAWAWIGLHFFAK